MSSEKPKNPDIPTPTPSETGMHGTVPVEAKGSAEQKARPGSNVAALAKITKVAAAATLAAALAATAVRKSGPKSPRTLPRVVAGKGDEDPCDRQTYAADAKPEEFAKPGESECRFVTDPDGKMRIIGHTLIDTDGKPRDCFLQPVFAPDAALKIRGEISGRMEQPGRIFLDKGKLCVMMLHEHEPEIAESLVIGEASLHITTTGKVVVKMLDAEEYQGTGKLLRYVMVEPVLGEVLIVQDGRSEQIRLKETDRPVKIPIDRLEQDGGCWIARPAREGGGESGGNGGAAEMILMAGALLLVLRRRHKND